MLRIKDQVGRTKFVLRDEDEEPVSIDELILNDELPPKKKSEEVEEEEDARN